MEAYIYDAVRTPRGKGRPDGALHEITALSLAAQALAAVRDRNDLDTALVDDVILGCVMPVGEQGSDISARMVAMLIDPAFAFDHSYASRGIGADLIATLHGYRN